MTRSKIDFKRFQSRKKDRFGGLFLFPKIGKIEWVKFSNFTNRITLISQAEWQTEKHRQSTEFSQFSNKVKMQFNKHECKQITNRTKEKEKKKRKKQRKEIE